MKVLIVAASRHGSTAEIGQAIGEQLSARGHDVDVVDPTEASLLDSHDALVIGSAVYAGSWLKDAREFVQTEADVLTTKKVWLFSSGPLDDPDGTTISTQKVEQLTSTTGSLGHHVFAGRLDRSALSRSERLLTKIVHAPDGDFRDWDDVTRWADQIADALV